MHSSFVPLTSARTVVVPLPTAVMVPLEVTVATEAFSLVNVTCAPSGDVADNQRRLLAGIEQRHIRGIQRRRKLFRLFLLLFGNEIAGYQTRCRLVSAGCGNDPPYRR